MGAVVNAGAAPAGHEPLSFFGGDDWQIDVTFLDANGTPLDLTAATILWTLLNAAGTAALTSSQFTVTVGTQPGQCTLTVPAASSTTLAGGTYSDAWRLTINNVASTMLYGSVIVRADPFAAAAASSVRTWSRPRLAA